MSDGFPLLTTKKMAWKSIITELLWFLRGDTNIKFLLDYDCHIWDGDAYKNYVDKSYDVLLKDLLKNKDTSESNNIKLNALSKEEFIKQIKTDNEFAKKWGDLGPIYGKQWRQWGGLQDLTDDDKPIYLDQIQNLIDELKTNPDSRRLMVSAWNVGALESMVLPPCHYGFQVYTRELSKFERTKWWGSSGRWYGLSGDEHFLDKVLDKHNIPKRAISLMWNQRSVDTFLGLPFNIASYALLLEIIAKEVNMVPDELIGNLGDVHLYKNHIEQAKMQILRKPYSLPKVNITERNWYLHEKVKEHLGPKSFNDKILSYRPDCFELVGYESHSGIKAPLSN
jgi:thymidylate synthase